MLQDCDTLKPQWEYLKLVDVSVDRLNAAGVEGWELVGLTSYQTGGGMTFDGVGGSKYTVHVEYLLKRPLHGPRAIARPGSIDLANSQYRLYLARKYEIQFEHIILVYLLNGEVYAQLDEALIAAHKLELEEMANEARLQKMADEARLQKMADEARIKNELIINAKTTASATGVHPDVAALMKRLNIRFEGGKFIFQTYGYEELQDAVNYAKKTLGLKD